MDDTTSTGGADAQDDRCQTRQAPQLHTDSGLIMKELQDMEIIIIIVTAEAQQLN